MPLNVEMTLGASDRDFPVAFWSYEMWKLSNKVGAAVVVLLAAVPAFAAIDTAAATTGISDASTAVLIVLAAMITMAAAVFGVRKVLALIRG